MTSNPILITTSYICKKREMLSSSVTAVMMVEPHNPLRLASLLACVNLTVPHLCIIAKTFFLYIDSDSCLCVFRSTAPDELSHAKTNDGNSSGGQSSDGHFPHLLVRAKLLNYTCSGRNGAITAVAFAGIRGRDQAQHQWRTQPCTIDRAGPQSREILNKNIS